MRAPVVVGTVGRPPVFGVRCGAARVPIETGLRRAGRRPGQPALLRVRLPVRLMLPVRLGPGGLARAPIRVRLGARRRLACLPPLVRLRLAPFPVTVRLPARGPVGALPPVGGYARLAAPSARGAFLPPVGTPFPLPRRGVLPRPRPVPDALPPLVGGTAPPLVRSTVPRRVRGAVLGGNTPLVPGLAGPLARSAVVVGLGPAVVPWSDPRIVTALGTAVVVALCPVVVVALGTAVVTGFRPAIVARARPVVVTWLRPPVVARVRPLVRRRPALVLARLGQPARLRAAGGRDGAVPSGRLVPWRAGVVAVVVARPEGVGRPARAGAAGPVEAVPGVAVRRFLPVRRLPIVRPGRLRVRPAVRLVVAPPVGAAKRAAPAFLPAVPAFLPAGPAVGVVVPGPAEVGPVGSGRRERGHLGAADGDRPAPGRGRGVLDADVAGVALARELRVPLGGRLDHPGRFAGVVPPVGVAAHLGDLSPRRVSGTAAARRR
ncbi:hypothetical protein [Micromonospora sp. NPDC023814]|uniref:hypothetical protein n=1 Tax=Micromonospora sp. NPDC023814 TaxID=3154596 RepID=UPI0033E9122B